MLNVKCQMSNVKSQMLSVNEVKLLSERTSGVPPVIFGIRKGELAFTSFFQLSVYQFVSLSVLSFCQFVSLLVC